MLWQAKEDPLWVSDGSEQRVVGVLRYAMLLLLSSLFMICRVVWQVMRRLSSVTGLELLAVVGLGSLSVVVLGLLSVVVFGLLSVVVLVLSVVVLGLVPERGGGRQWSIHKTGDDTRITCVRTGIRCRTVPRQGRTHVVWRI